MRPANDEPNTLPMPGPWSEPESQERSGITYALVGAYASLILFVIW